MVSPTGSTGRSSRVQVEQRRGLRVLVDLGFGRVGHRQDERVARPLADPVDQLDPSVTVLDEGGTALYPVAVVAIENAAQIAHLGVVDMAADDAVDAAPARFFGDR